MSRSICCSSPLRFSSKSGPVSAPRIMHMKTWMFAPYTLESPALWLMQADSGIMDLQPGTRKLASLKDPVGRVSNMFCREGEDKFHCGFLGASSNSQNEV